MASNMPTRETLCLSLLIATVLHATAGATRAQSNIDPTDKWSWGENGGWTNWYDNGVTSGAVVGDYVLSGFVWGENIGWIYLGDGAPAAGDYYGNAAAADTGVNIAVNGDLFGFGWSENVGWINFGTAVAAPNQARIEVCCPNGRFFGYAWGENIGWINLNTAFGFVGLAPSAVRAKGDLDGSGTRDGLDIAGFVATFLAPAAATPAEFCAADMNGDGILSDADVVLFVTCLLTGVCVCP